MHYCFTSSSVFVDGGWGGKEDVRGKRKIERG